MMIYDTFLFYNEFEALDIRLNELNDIVDKFVLVEATVTHTNKPKPLYFNENKEKYKKFLNKIIYVKVDDSPNVSMPWIIERHQLSAVMRGLKNCKSDDLILYSCVDEIPKGEKVLYWMNKKGKNKVFMHSLSLYYLNFVEKTKEIEGTRMFYFKYLKDFGDIYFTRYLNPDVVINHGGWHFSYMGGIKRIQKKLNSYAHQEYNNDKFNTPEKIRKSILQGKDPFGLGWRLKVVNLSTLPKYVIENKNKFINLIFPEEEAKARHLKLTILLLDALHYFRILVFRTIKRNLTAN